MPSPAAGRALPPAAAFVLQKAFASVQACTIDEIRVEGYYVLARLCLRDAPQACFSVRLDDPEGGCDGDQTGPWCVRWAAGDPPAEVRAAVREALRTSKAPWIELGPLSEREHLDLPQPEQGPAQLHARPLALAIVLLAVPLLAGFVLGHLLRGSRWPWPRLVGIAIAGALTVLAIELLQRVGAWDIFSLGVLVSAGVLGGTARVDPRRVALFVTASAIGLTGLELAVRRWLPPAPLFPPPEDASFIIDVGGWDIGCSVLYGPDGPDNEIQRLHAARDHGPTKHGPLVVHLGDSMTFGFGVRSAEAFPALLDARDPEVIHANYGVSAVGTDFEYLLLQKILAGHPAALVVLHVYVGNDIFDIDRPYECCDMGPLLMYPSGGPRARCPDARWGFTLASRLGRSPAPYPLRVATAWSHAARHATAAFSRLVFELDRPPNFINFEGEATEAGWSHFAEILTATRDEIESRGAELIVDLLPNRQAVESTDPANSPSYRTRRRIATITAQLGIRTLDAWDVFVDAVQRDGARRYFLGESDIHFTPEGHRLLADWLAGQLSPLPSAHPH